MKARTSLVLLSAAGLVAACGGGDYSNAGTPATSQVPASASQSVDGFISYLKLLVASEADTLEPVDTSAVVGPTDDTAEPQKVD